MSSVLTIIKQLEDIDSLPEDLIGFSTISIKQQDLILPSGFGLKGLITGSCLRAPGISSYVGPKYMSPCQTKF